MKNYKTTTSLELVNALNERGFCSDLCVSLDDVAGVDLLRAYVFHQAVSSNL